MTRHESPAVEAAYLAWTEAVVFQADHRIDCASGCSIVGDVCSIGISNAAREQERWRAYYDLRTAGVV